jgi:hypothetical protein
MTNIPSICESLSDMERDALNGKLSQSEWEGVAARRLWSKGLVGFDPLYAMACRPTGWILTDLGIEVARHLRGETIPAT